MKIALAQLNYHIGNFESNFNKVIIIDSEENLLWIEGTKLEVSKGIFDYILK